MAVKTETLALSGTSNPTTGQQKFLCLAGVHVSHSFAPSIHNYIAETLGLPWEFSNRECPTLQDVMALFRAPDFAGGVVTMPYKKTIIQSLDELDPLVTTLGACNNVYLTKEGRLRGTNTDWRGIKGCLLSGTPDGRNEGKGSRH